MAELENKTLETAYGPSGWLLWPDWPVWSSNFLRVLASAPEGACTVGEAMQVGSRITPGDADSWHREWVRAGEISRERADEAENAGHKATARATFLRAANYFRAAEYFLPHGDERRLTTFDLVEQCSHRHLALLEPAGEVLRIPFEDTYLDAYFVAAPASAEPRPVVICFGGADEYKDELLHEVTSHAFARGLSLLLVDLPGQGGSLRRRNLHARGDSEKPVGACVDYLLSRGDIDPDRIALYGASVGGYYAPRAAAFEHRIACVVTDGAMWNMLADRDWLLDVYDRDPSGIPIRQMMWLTGTETIEETADYLADWKLEGVLDKITCPYLVVHGDQDIYGLDLATESVAYAESHGVDVTLKLFTPEETGASHCQIDNPTLGQEYICDWIADQLGVTQ